MRSVRFPGPKGIMIRVAYHHCLFKWKPGLAHVNGSMGGNIVFCFFFVFFVFFGLRFIEICQVTGGIR
jgi:hypothetical protein